MARYKVLTKWQDVDPIIRKIAARAHKLGFRITSIVRPNSRSHAKGWAIDLAPMMYSSSWADIRAARDAYGMFSSISPHIMVVGEDDHIHIGVKPPFGVGYDGRKGRVIPRGVPKPTN